MTDESRWSSFDDLAEWLEREARRIKAARETGYGGTTHRYDLVHFADGIQWAARHARDRAPRPSPPTDEGTATG